MNGTALSGGLVGKHPFESLAQTPATPLVCP